MGTTDGAVKNTRQPNPLLEWTATSSRIAGVPASEIVLIGNLAVPAPPLPLNSNVAIKRIQ